MGRNWLSNPLGFLKKICGNDHGGAALSTEPSEPAADTPTEVFAFTLYGAHGELHDRIQGMPGNFKAKVDAIIKCVKDKKTLRVVVGISRYNFYCIPEIINFCFDLLLINAHLTRTFDIFPVESIAQRYRSFITDSIKEIAFQNIIHIEYQDNDLENILEGLQSRVRDNRFKERDYIRYFSMICEKTFIGPATIVMDPFHRCNTNCRHCWVHTPNVTQPQEFLERKINIDLFKQIVDDAAELKSDLIILQGDGEPLMYEHTMEMLRYIRKSGIEAMFFTNGSLLDERKAREIIEMDVKEIYCSLPAGTKETYGNVCPIHKNDDFFDRIVTNMTNFIKLRKKMGKERPHLVLSHVMSNANYQDLIPMAELAARIGADAVRYYLIRLDVMNKDLKLEDEHVERMHRDLAVAEKIMKKNGIHFIDNIRFQFENYDGATGAWCKDVFLQEGCSIGWFFCLIPALTDLSLCCHLRTVGWLNKTGFKDLWLSPEYERYRRQAKYLKYNQDVSFMNGVKLFDEHCTHCDNHQTLISNVEEMKKLGWYKYLNL